MVVHPGSGNAAGTLVNALLFHYAGLRGRSAADNARPGIVHRLDKDTSGVIIVARNARGPRDARRASSGTAPCASATSPSCRACRREPEGRVENRLARDPRDRKRFACVADAAEGRPSRATACSGAFGAGKDGYALVLLAPRTGRTHQLRVHMRHLGYSRSSATRSTAAETPRFPDATLMLHARSLSIVLPGEEEPRTFVAPLPERFSAVLRRASELLAEQGIVELLDAHLRRRAVARENRAPRRRGKGAFAAPIPAAARAHSRPASSRLPRGEPVAREEHVSAEEAQRVDGVARGFRSPGR